MTKEDLKGYIETKRELKFIEEKIDYLTSKKTSIKSQVITDMPKGASKNNDILIDLLGELEDITEIYNKKYIKLLKKQIEIEHTIDKLDNATDRNVMRLRYLEGYKWEKICVIMNYSWEGIHKIHRNILEKIK